MSSITFQFPALPESVNKMYFSRGGRRVPTAACKKYKNSFVAMRGGLTATELMRFVADNDVAYELHLWFYLPPEKLYNLTYGTNKSVKSPFKDVDTSNFIKLAEDSISQLLGLRDRNHWTVCAHKREGDARMAAILRPLNIREDPHAFPG